MKGDRLSPAPTDALKLCIAFPDGESELTPTPAKFTPGLLKYATPAPENGPVLNSDWGLYDAPLVSVRMYPPPLASTYMFSGRNG